MNCSKLVGLFRLVVVKNIGSVKIGDNWGNFLLYISLSMCRKRRNEDAVDEDVDHEAARETPCKAELTIPNHCSKHIFHLCSKFSDW